MLAPGTSPPDFRCVRVCVCVCEYVCMIGMMIISGLQEALFPPGSHVLCLPVDKKSKNLEIVANHVFLMGLLFTCSLIFHRKECAFL